VEVVGERPLKVRGPSMRKEATGTRVGALGRLDFDARWGGRALEPKSVGCGA
jgi:hypothetical protein